MKLNAQQLIEYAIEYKLDSVLINTLKPFKSLEKTHLLKLKEMADKNNISLYIGAGSISEESNSYKNTYGSAKDLLLEGIRVASILGSPIVGCRIGNIKDRYQPGGIKAHMKAVINVMRSLRKEALEAGVLFAMENHAGDLRVEEILEIIEETGTDIAGILYDPANAVWAMEDPMESLQRLKKHILCTSVRDVMIWESKEGAIFQGMAIGEGMMNFRKYAEIMAKSCPGVPLHVETISNSARPIPFKTDEFLKGWPEVSQSKINEFARLASKGRALELLTPEEGISKRDFDIRLQQSELQKSFDYLRNHCNAGLKVDVN
jgi:sugar phosphate isomerase/epimerase